MFTVFVYYECLSVVCIWAYGVYPACLYELCESGSILGVGKDDQYLQNLSFARNRLARGPSKAKKRVPFVNL